MASASVRTTQAAAVSLEGSRRMCMRGISIADRYHRRRPLLLGREMREDGVRALAADDAFEVFAGGPPDPGDAAERDEQRLAPPRTDTTDLVHLGPQVALRSRSAVEGHGKAVRLVADPLDQEQRWTVHWQRDPVDQVPGEDQLLFLRNPDRHQIRQPKLLERLVGRGQLPLAAIDQDQIGEW